MKLSVQFYAARYQGIGIHVMYIVMFVEALLTQKLVNSYSWADLNSLCFLFQETRFKRITDKRKTEIPHSGVQTLKWRHPHNDWQ
jgi:hypothetical protein